MSDNRKTGDGSPFQLQMYQWSDDISGYMASTVWVYGITGDMAYTIWVYGIIGDMAIAWPVWKPAFHP